MKVANNFLKILILLLFVSNNTFCSSIKWHSVDDLLSGKNIEKKPIYIYIHTKWDGFSKKFEKETLTNKHVIDYLNEVFYCVKFDAEDKKNYTLKNKLYSPTKIGRRPVHSLILKWFGNNTSFPTNYFMYQNLKPIIHEPGYKNAENFLIILENLKVKKGYPKKLLNPNFTELNTAISKIIASYKNEFKSIKGKKLDDKVFKSWKSKIQIPNQINSTVAEYSYSDGSRMNIFSSRLLQNIPKEEAIDFTKKFVLVLLKSNLKKELKAYYLSQKIYNNSLGTKIHIFPHKEDNVFKNISISIKIDKNNFFNKNMVDVNLVITDRNDK